MLEYKYYNGPGLEHIVLLHGIGGNSQIFYKQINEYRKKFNVLAIHLPGHGASPDLDSYEKNFSYDLIIEEINKTLDQLKIYKAHFIGISLGSIIIHHLLQRNPERVISAVLGGAVTKFNHFSKALMLMGRLVKNFTPHMWIYKLFAHIMMPKKNHGKSRSIFIREAKNMKRDNFLSWFDLIRKVEQTYVNVQLAVVPKLYISGQEDHLFIKDLEKDITSDKNAQIIILEDCGHVCNIEKAEEFNSASMDFILNHSISSNAAIVTG